jgi:hypothetical protein
MCEDAGTGQPITMYSGPLADQSAVHGELLFANEETRKKWGQTC